MTSRYGDVYRRTLVDKPGPRRPVATLQAAGGARTLRCGVRPTPHPWGQSAFNQEVTRDVATAAVAGDSAGGGLTVATLVAIRDAKLPLPAAGACLSPWVDLEGIGESMTTKAGVDPIVQKAGLLQMSAAYLGGKDARTPLAAPLYADLSGLPPLLIQVGRGAAQLQNEALPWKVLLPDGQLLLPN
jgi:epsilon-lactone hydrolase